MKARTLKHVISNFRRRVALEPDELDAWFIEREGSPRRRMKIALGLATKQKVLLIGHRGSGKSTELRKLAEEMENEFELVGFDVLDITGRTNIEYEDLMLSISTQVTRHCIQKNLVRQPLAGPVQQKLEELRDWWMQVVAGTGFRPASAEVEIGLQIETLLGQVEIGVQQSSQTREAIKDQINRQMPDLIRRLNWVIEQAEAGNRKKLMLVVEGMDKINQDCAMQIFRDQSPTITAPNATMIFTFPIALRHTDDYNSIRLKFDHVWFLPNISVFHSDGTTLHDEGVEASRNLVLSRMEENLIEGAALDLLVRNYGGIPVRMVYLVQLAATFALARDERAASITTADVEDAIKELRREMRTPLTRKDLEVLSERHRDRTLTNDEIEQRLLYNGSLIDYSNGETWCDAHPALWSLL
ncbi:MAG TPA: hypothetical protein VGE45_11070 [Chloroflexia bacterium]|jgi:energy-coupling factor transporter ATP-binding protein EcfA2